MPSVIDYFHPCSNKFHAQKDFKRLDCGKRAGTVILTALAALLSLGVAGSAVFRLLVRHFSRIESNKGTKSSIQKIRNVGEPVITKDSTPIKSFSLPNLHSNRTPLFPEQDLLYPKTSHSRTSLYSEEDFWCSNSDEAYESSVEASDEEGWEYVADPSVAQREKFKRLAFLEGCLNSLNDLLTLENKKCGVSINNGDCFYDAFAIKLNEFGILVTAKQLRENVSWEALRIHEENPDRNWIKTELEGENDFDFEKASDSIGNTVLQRVSYLEFIENVQFSAEEALSERKVLIWGNQNLDGRILANLYNVNLRVVEVGYIPHFEPSDSLAYFKNDNSEWIVRDMECPFTVELGLIPEHFMPIQSID